MTKKLQQTYSACAQRIGLCLIYEPIADEWKTTGTAAVEKLRRQYWIICDRVRFYFHIITVALAVHPVPLALAYAGKVCSLFLSRIVRVLDTIKFL